MKLNSFLITISVLDVVICILFLSASILFPNLDGEFAKLALFILALTIVPPWVVTTSILVFAFIFNSLLDKTLE